MSTTTNRHDPGRTRTRARAAATATLLVLFGLLVAACGGSGSEPPGVAAVDSTTDTQDGGGSASDASDGGEPDMVEYSKCMRENGVSGFPDPNGEGGLELDADSLGVPPDSPQFQAAEEACSDLLPRVDAEEQTDRYEAQLSFAQCMRDEGIASFPDPEPPSEGPQTERGGTSDLGFDPESPQFKAAEDACEDLLPAEAGERSVSEGPG